GGEVLSTDILSKIRSRNQGLIVINHYGPTETTIGKLLHQVDLEHTYASVPIGKPFSNTQVYVVDETYNICPIGVPGELLIGGNGVSAGYLNRPELTAEKFVNNPFSEASKAKLYRTGDLVRRLPNGEIDFLGRIDDQVKIRGYRVELKEIESVIRQSAFVKDCTVLTRQDQSGIISVAAYIVPQDQFDRVAIQEDVAKTLPDYMLPTFWVEIAQVPLTKNGKVNRRELEKLELTSSSVSHFVAPANELQGQLVEIWSNLLQVNPIGIRANFFELGGHSLLAMQLVSAIRSQLNSELEVKDVFIQPTIEGLARMIEENQTTVKLPPIKAGDDQGKAPLSFAQERMWFIDQYEGSIQYHMHSVLKLEEDLDRGALEKALSNLVDRHQVLRTIIQSEKGAAHQVVMPTANWQMQFSEGQKFQDESFLLSFVHKEVNQPFDLSSDYMIRAHLVKTTAATHYLILTMHHIASDGWSNAILVRDLREFYQAELEQRTPNLALLNIQYTDYARWQRENLSGKQLETQLDWWEDQLNGLSPLLLPTDYQRAAIQKFEGGNVHFQLGNTVAEQLKALSVEAGASLFMTLLSVFKVLLYRYSGQSDICVGTPVANRNHKEIESLVGLFLNSLSLRSDLSHAPTFVDLLTQVKNNTLAAFTHQEVPFEQVVDRVETERSRNHNPIFQVLFIMQNTPDTPEFTLDGTSISSQGSGLSKAEFDLTLTVVENDSGLSMVLNYRKDLFKDSTIERMAKHFQNLLTAILSDPQQKITELSILSKDEAYELTHTFNHTKVPFPQDQSLLGLFEKQATEKADAIAVQDRKTKLSYRELDQQSNQLASFIEEKYQVKSGDIVGISLENSCQTILSILSLLKLNITYLPIDPSNPAGRIQFINEDANTVLTIDDIVFNAFEQVQNDYSTLSVNRAKNGATPLALIYTSGSTSQP
ncbi:MAG: condensation domain-containing protein, partial [Bacteroidota bacterium]